MNAIHTSISKSSISYPNAADRRYHLEKVTDSILSAAICIGIVTVLFFLITMF